MRAQQHRGPEVEALHQLLAGPPWTVMELCRKLDISPPQFVDYWSGSLRVPRRLALRVASLLEAKARRIESQAADLRKAIGRLPEE